jgi:CHAD domain-containing protein
VTDRILSTPPAGQTPTGLSTPSAGRSPTGHGPARSSASAALRTLLDDQVTAVQAADGGLRTSGWSGIHRMRVALRRLRSTLTAFRPFLDGSVEGLRDELRWFASELSPARDAEVLRARFEAACADDPLLGTGALAVHDPGLVAEELEASGRAEEAWASARYADLAASLVRLCGSELITVDPGVSAEEAFLPLVAEEMRRVRRRAEQVEDGGDRDEQLHELRKATKRARYTSEALIPFQPKRAKKLARRLEKLQILLGDRQDSTVARQFLHRVRDSGGLDEHGQEVVERLLARERASTASIDERLPGALAKATRPGRLLPP